MSFSTPIRTIGETETSVAFKRRFMIRMMLVLTGGQFLDGYILGIVGPVTAKMTAGLGISTVWEGLIAAGALFGILFGSPLGGWAADKFGRKPLFMLDMVLFLVSSAMQFFVSSPLELLIVRLLMGIAIGAEYSVGWPLMSEFAPPKLRGRLMGAAIVAWYTGFMVAFAAGYVFDEVFHWGWRSVLGTSTFIAAVLIVGRIGLPESPRWLWNQKRFEEAHAIAWRYMESKDIADIECESTSACSARFRTLFSSQYWRATFFVSMFWFCAVTPYFAIATFADSVLKKYNLDAGLRGGLGLSAVALAGVVITVLLIDKVGRRALTVPTQWVCTIVLATIGLWANAPAAAVLALFLIFSFFNAGPTTLSAIYPSEVFPTEVRGIGTGFAAGFSRIGAGLGTFLLPWSMANIGASGTMLIAAAIAAIGAGVSQWLAPETKGKSLTETAASYTH
ncbi:major facilitator transporter [Caballeronia hypogeia]|uniref:Major facilitator transporter n=1 Tax=Caballeronia hypogeia TaxID=1777140 RepID=A0A158CZQ4_9BURK|nr:MFS transporter [Caballeronia hypogeia]SAK87721.1 major facilitator transporter [Caballeronia hypogeia]